MDQDARSELPPISGFHDDTIVASSEGVEDCDAIDPAFLLDPTDGRLWLTYATNFGYIRIVELDPKTGKRVAGNKPVNVAIDMPLDAVKFEKKKGKLQVSVNVLGIAYTPDGGVGARFSDTVKLEYRRGSETKTATLVTDEQQGYVLSGPSMREFEMPRMQMPFMTAPEGQSFSFCFGDAWCDLDLVTLNSDLGDYFGTKEGVLVVKAPGDSALPLKSGDVILSIGGRKPTSPSHAMRILRSYDAGESVSIEIMRHQRRQTLNWTVPQAGEMRRMRPARPRGEQSLWIAPGAANEWARVTAERSLQSALRARRLSDATRERALQSMQQRLETLRVRMQKRLSITAI